MSSYDTIIIGSSPNALTAAAYLSRSNERVLVLEPSKVLGGAYSTREFANEFSGDVSVASGRVHDDVIKDLNLKQHGLETIERTSITSLLPGGRSFSLHQDLKKTKEEIAKLSKKDAEQFEKFTHLLELATDFLKAAYEATPPQQHPPTAIEAAALSQLVAKLKGYGRRETTEVLRVLLMPVRDLLDEWFESPELKGLLASAAVRGITSGPFASSTTFNLLHNLALGDGYFRAAPKGGIGSISHALATAAKSFGAEIQTHTGKLSVIIEDGKATGVQLDSGAAYKAHRVISDFDARFTFTNLVAPPELEPEFNRTVKTTRYKGSVARLNFALDALPAFDNLSPELLRGTLVVSPDVKYLEKAYDAAKYGSVSEAPYLEITIPSLTDASLAPTGAHVMSVWFQYAPYGSKTSPEKLKEITLKVLSNFAPALPSLVRNWHCSTPESLEQEFGLTEGQIFGGETNLTQAFYLRPIPGFSQYKTPVENLYLCGCATHPGGPVSGLSGKNAVKQFAARPLAMSK